MPRKFFQKYLPSHEAIRNNRYIARFGTFFLHPNLWHVNRRSVAGGVASGLFAGLVPGSNPVQFAVAALLAVAFRVNLPVAAAVTLYTNPLTIGPLYVIAYWIGTLFVPGDGGARQLFSLAAAAGVQVRHLRPSVATLEDVFAHAVGED